MKSLILAIAALIWVTGCNKQSKETARENAVKDSTAKAAEANGQAAAKDTSAAGKSMGEKAKEATSKAGHEVAEGATAAADKTKEVAGKAGAKVEGVFLQDKAVTEADAKTNEKIRAALKKDKKIASEASDINIVTKNGIVSLHGTVTSASARNEIVRIAGQVAGKVKVGNDIKVAERVGTGPE